MESAMAGLLLLLALSFSLLFAPSLSSSLQQPSRAAARPRQREFDYFVLALQWPGTFCQRTRHCCPSNGCCRSSVALDEFTIHGLWTDYNDGTWPACCSNSRFDIKRKARYLLLPVINDEFSYFLTALDLYFKHNMTKVLNDAGFSANNSEKYQLSAIVAAVKNSTGASPLLVCSHDAIQELRLCFYKDFKPRDCTLGPSVLGGPLNSRISCPKYVSLPEHAPVDPRNKSVMVTWSPDTDDFELVAQD